MNVNGDIGAVRLFECDRIFRDMIVREPIVSLAEAILTEDCHLMAQNVVRNPPGKSVDRWHTDGSVEFPCPPDMPRHDPRFRIPVFRLTNQMLLTDVESMEYGPTQYVPGSHYSGRTPNDPINPSFEGRGPVAVLGKAGDIYLHQGMCWHRGAPNTSNRVRYMMQNHYCQWWVAHRFYPFIDYRMPDYVRAGADQRMLRLLGKKQTGAYG